jgi:hypothetical protein
MTDIQFTIGDTLPKIEATLQDRNGAVNLTSATVRFVSPMGIDEPCTIVSAVNGQVEVVLDNVTFIAGTWTARFVVTFADDSVLSFPNSDPFLYMEIFDQSV